MLYHWHSSISFIRTADFTLRRRKKKSQTVDPNPWGLFNKLSWDTLNCNGIPATQVEGSHPVLQTKASLVVALKSILEPLGIGSIIAGKREEMGAWETLHLWLQKHRVYHPIEVSSRHPKIIGLNWEEKLQFWNFGRELHTFPGFLWLVEGSVRWPGILACISGSRISSRG
jgi:hypothetical protein